VACRKHRVIPSASQPWPPRRISSPGRRTRPWWPRWRLISERLSGTQDREAAALGSRALPDGASNWSNRRFARWFEGGTTNLAYQLASIRHRAGPRAEKNGSDLGKANPATRAASPTTDCMPGLQGRPMPAGLASAKVRSWWPFYMPMVPEARHRHAGLRPHRVRPISWYLCGFSAEALRDV